MEKRDIVVDLQRLGLERGDEVVVHSSLSSIGWVQGGPDTVVEALLEVVGQNGLVAVPTFTVSQVDDEPFDVHGTPSETGQITEALRYRDDTHRSHHPTHSVAAIGAGAETVVAEHPLLASLGENSPLHRLSERGGKILLIGVNHTSNSTIHVAEKLAALPYKDLTREVGLRDPSGGVRTVTTSRAGCSGGFDQIESAADRAGIVSRGTVGDATAQLMPGNDLLEVAQGLLDDDPGALLCDSNECTCARSRALLENRDW